MHIASMLSSGTYLEVGVIQISLANVLVILCMVIVFILALVVPFPHADEKSTVRDESR